MKGFVMSCTPVRAGGSAIAAAAASLILTNALGSTTVFADDAVGHCVGANACKGQSACAGAKNSCAGQNACKGQGFTMATKDQCAKLDGKFEPAK
jgi:hypothetical protein